MTLTVTSVVTLTVIPWHTIYAAVTAIEIGVTPNTDSDIHTKVINILSRERVAFRFTRCHPSLNHDSINRIIIEWIIILHCNDETEAPLHKEDGQEMGIHRWTIGPCKPPVNVVCTNVRTFLCREDVPRMRGQPVTVSGQLTGYEVGKANLKGLARPPFIVLPKAIA